MIRIIHEGPSASSLANLTINKLIVCDRGEKYFLLLDLEHTFVSDVGER